MPFREQNSRLTVIIDGVNLGVWDQKTGGDTDSNSTQYFKGGMGPRISLGGAQQVNNLVLNRLEDTDIVPNVKWLRSRAGKGNGTMTEQRLDDDGAAWGDPDVYDCKLKRVKPSDRNANSNNAAILEIELEVNGPVA